MNYNRCFWIFAMLFSMTSFVNAQLKTLSNGKQIDEKLVGVWTGSETDKQIKGVSKKWEMTRNEDGTFILDFTFTQDGETQNTMESGNWWVENGNFYEYHEGSEQTDIYEYKAMGNTRVKFKSKSMSTEMNTDAYEFVDTKVISSTKKDGLSLNNAVKIKSVPAEYQYIKEVCKGCQPVKQSLTFKGNKYYDVIKVTKPDGNEIDYYFDVTSFYGKF